MELESDSAIRSAVTSGIALVETLIPYIETYKKWNEFAPKLEDAFNEVFTVLGIISLKIQEQVKLEFFPDNVSLPKPEALKPEIHLLNPSKNESDQAKKELT
jgi:hypothetical protein